MDTKKCCKCKRVLPLTTEYFAKHSKRYDGFQTQCKECNNKYQREWVKDNPKRDKYIKEYNHTDENRYKRFLRHKERRYNLSEQDIRDMMDEQRGCCYICSASLINPLFNKTDLHVDHNHDTGEVRKLLCGTCNTLVAVVEDKRDLLRMIEQYLGAY